MTNHLIALSDGSDFSWRAVRLAARLSTMIDLPLEVVEVALLPGDVGVTERSLRQRVDDELPDLADSVTVNVLVQDDRIASTIAAYVEALGDGSLVVMSSVGRGRSAALLGSIAEDLLHHLLGPILVLGPEVDPGRFHLDGRLLVPVDGSATSEYALGLAAAWGIEHGAVPWLVHVVDPSELPAGGDVDETAYVARTAQHLREQSHHGVEFEVLHGHSAHRAVIDAATAEDVSLIVTSTHGRTGLARVAAGSEAMGMIHGSPVPVLLVRPPTLPS
jgi:nucleotide-binding universal stress UspA family protein